MGQAYSQPGSEGSLEQIRGWNWGAFLLHWIWAIGNNVWIGLIALVPIVQVVMAIILGVKGNEWAWQSRTWESVDQFKRTQAAWTLWGAIVFGVWLIFILPSILAAILVPLYMRYWGGSAIYP